MNIASPKIEASHALPVSAPARLRFRIGQVWNDQRGRNPQTIVAITGHADAPIITQDGSGDACAYRADGSFPISNSREYDLVTLISDAEVDHSTEAF